MAFKFWDSWTNGRADTGRRSPKKVRRQALCLEALEERKLLSTTAIVTFDDGSGTPLTASVGAYSWGVNSTTPESAGTSGPGVVGKPNLQEFTLTMAGDDAPSELWSHLITGSHLNSATIEVQPDQKPDPVGIESIEYTLTDVVVTSFTTSAGETNTVQLQFGEIAESCSVGDFNAPSSTLNAAQYNLSNPASNNAGGLSASAADYGMNSLSQSSPTPSTGLTFVDGGVTEPALQVQDYTWGAVSAGGGGSARVGKPGLQDFTLGLDSTSVEPGLWGNLAVGTHLDSATIYVSETSGNESAEYATYTLTDVTITSFSTTYNGGGEHAPQDTIQLAFGSIAESYTPLSTAGVALGKTDTAQYSLVSNTNSAGSLASPASDTPTVGLTLVDGGVAEAELSVASYSWGTTAGSGMANTPSLQNFTLTLESTSVEPGLWGHLIAGSHLDSATIHVRQSSTELLTYTLTDVTISSFTTSDTITDAPVDTIQLAFGSIAESYTPLSTAGVALGKTDTAQYSLVSNTNSAGSLASPASDTPTVGLTLVDGGVAEAELSVASYSWGTTAGSGMANTPSLQNFTLTLESTSVEPGLWGHPIAGSHLDSATIHVRQSSTELLTYTLTDVTISSFSTTYNGGGEHAPQDTIQLAFGSIAESYTPLSAAGVALGNTNTAQYSLVSNTNSAGSLASPASDTPTVGLTLVDGGVAEAELSVASYSWGTTAGSGMANTPSLQNFTLTLEPTSVEPGLWGHLIAGSHLDSATIHMRQQVNSQEVEYITYTLTDVTLTSFTTTDNGKGSPRDTIQLAFGSIAESYTPLSTAGVALGKTDTTQYSPVTNTNSAGSLTPVSEPTTEFGMTLVEDGVAKGELPVAKYSWGVTVGSGMASTPSLQDFTVTLEPTSIEPGLWGNLTVGTHLDSITILERQNILEGSTHTVVGPVILTFTLTDATITSFATSDDGSGAPIDTVQLGFEKVTESFSSINPNGSLNPATIVEYDRITHTSGDGGDSAETGSPAPMATTTVLSASQSSTIYGQAAVFTVIVSPITAGTAAPAGTVDFFDGAIDISGPVTLATVNGQQVATFTTTALDVAHSPHTITATYNGNAAFAASTSNALREVVSPAPLTITAADQTKVYGAALPALTADYSGFANGDTTASLTALPTLATTATAASSVGDYAITVNGAADPNYAITYVNGTLTVTPAALTVAVNNTTGVYGAPLPAFTVSYSGFVGGDGPSVLGGGLTFSTTATAASAPGAYTVSASGLTPANYQVRYVSGTLTIDANAYQIVPDALDATKSVLVVGGSPHSETIFVAPGSRHGTLALFINGVKHDNIAAAPGTTFSRVRIYGGAGNDVLQVSPLLTLTSELYADSGNDVLIGGSGNNILVGGTGHSTLIGGKGRNLLIGGSAGGDVLRGGRGDNLEIAGSTVWDQDTLALDSIMAEWASNDSYAVRIADITGATSDPAFNKRQNGQYFLNTNTVHSAADRDVLIGGHGRDLFFAELVGQPL